MEPLKKIQESECVRIEGCMQFGHAPQFKAQEISDFLGLTKRYVSRLASVAETSVSFDGNMPTAVRTCLEELAETVNLVAQQFRGIRDKRLPDSRPGPLCSEVSPHAT